MNTTTRERMDEETGELVPMQEVLAPESTTAVVAITAEINQQVATARRFPRRRDRDIADAGADLQSRRDCH